MVRLAARIGELEQDVAEREEWVAASLSAEEMKRRAEAARRRRGPERINVRTRVAPAQVKTKAKQQARKRKKKRAKAQPKAKVAVLANALFANAGTARRIGFAIDISGSMGAPGFGAGQNRLDVVKEHLKGAIGSMEDTNCHTPMGDSLTPATWTGVKKAEACINEMQPGGGNGGEAACMRALLKMGPQAIFFLGDGGWGEQELLAAAGEAKKDGVTVHSIAFFTSGGGLPEIAAMTAGTYREINGPDDLDELPAAKTGPSAAARGAASPAFLSFFALPFFLGAMPTDGALQRSAPVTKFRRRLARSALGRRPQQLQTSSRASRRPSARPCPAGRARCAAAAAASGNP